jgi:ankyrin repeat protein
MKYEFEKALKDSKEYKYALKNLINYTDFKGKTALHYAAYRGELKLVQVLLKNGASVYIRDHKRRKPIDVAKGK